MTKYVLGIGAAGIAAAVTWWALFYTKVLELRGETMTYEDWNRGVSFFKDCMFWDRPQCVAVKETTNLTGYASYEPLFLWLSVGVILVGVLLRFRDVCKKGSRYSDDCRDAISCPAITELISFVGNVTLAKSS